MSQKNINKPIFLCGFMGSGKTTIGKRLANELVCEFTDMDDYIESQEGKSIAQIFKDSGEEYFRNLETALIRSFENKTGVIATGGGALLRDENAGCAKEIGTVVYIDVRFNTCYMRIKDDKNRPIAASSTRDELYERYKQRKPIYEKNSDFSVDGNHGALSVAKNIIEILHKNKER